MARRIISKACNDLVGGAGTDVSVSIGPELPRKSSALKLSSKDVSHGNRQAVEIRPIDVRQVSKTPLQIAHPLKRDNLKPEENSAGRALFVNIDGDGSAKVVDAPCVGNKGVPQTAYKMRSFMSTVELGPRGTSPSPTLVNQNAVKPPLRRPDIPDVSNRPEDARMFLPKGIYHTDQPYIVPKFMPPYREMMAPKPKPNPLVSIVEKTPPSLQKWAVEWNSDPKKTISIDELKEDLIREAAEIPPKRPSFHDSNPDKMCEDEKTEHPNGNLENQSSYPAPIEETSAPESRTTLEWKDLHLPTSYETTTGVQALRDPKLEQQKIGRPLVDWVPPKYSSPNRLPNDPRYTEYSFQEAIKNGTHKKTGKAESNAEPKLFFHKPPENAVYFETEEQKFHEWFKAKMSAAVQSAVNTPSKVEPNNSHARIHATQLNTNAHPTLKDSKKPGNMATSANPRGPEMLSQGERNPINNVIQNDSLKESNGMIPPEVRDHPERANTVSATSYEAESNSSFYHWLKLRGHKFVKNEPNLPEIKKEKEKTSQNFQPASRFPWSVSYTHRKRVSTPAFFPERRAHPKNIKKPQKTVPEGKARPEASKALKTSQKTVTQDNVTVKHAKDSIKKSVISLGRNSIKSAGKKFFKTNSKRSVKTAGKKPVNIAGKLPDKNSTKKTPKLESPKIQPLGPPSGDQLWLNDSWNVDSEIDHVNNVRKTEIFGNSPKATNMKKIFPSMRGPQMKYWESKYIKKPELAENQKVAADNEAKPNPNWFRSNKAFDIKKVLNEVMAVKHADDNGTDRHTRNSNFSTIAEYSSFPLKLSQTAKDEIMDFPDDFDVDHFLHKEEVVGKELLESTQGQQENTVKGEGKTENEQSTGKVKGKEHIKFPRSVKVHTEANEVDLSLRQRVQEKLNEDEFVLALGEEPGLEDLEWSEFIGPKNSLDDDSDLTRLIGAQARQLGSVQNSCL